MSGTFSMIQADCSHPLIGCSSRLSDYDGGDIWSLTSHSHGKFDILNFNGNL